MVSGRGIGRRDERTEQPEADARPGRLILSVEERTKRSLPTLFTVCPSNRLPGKLCRNSLPAAAPSIKLCLEMCLTELSREGSPL